MEQIAKRMLSGQAGVEHYVFKGVTQDGRLLACEADRLENICLSLPTRSSLRRPMRWRNLVLPGGPPVHTPPLWSCSSCSRRPSRQYPQGRGPRGQRLRGRPHGRHRHPSEGRYRQLAEALRNTHEYPGSGPSWRTCTGLRQRGGRERADVLHGRHSPRGLRAGIRTEEASSSMEQMASNIRQNADKRAADREDSGKVRRRRQGRRQGGRKTVEAMRTIAEKIAIVEEIPARQTFSR